MPPAPAAPGSEPGRVVIRPARPDDYDAVGRLLVDAYGPGGMPPDEPYWQALQDTAARTEDAEVWVADLDGRPVGTVTWAGRGSSQREVARDGEAEFRMLGVAPAAHGQGVGRALVEAVLDRAREDGYAAVVLSSDAWMSSAHRLYARLGFSRIPDRDWSPTPHVHLLAYRLHL